MTLRLPKLHGIIDRRILINFVADPNVVAKLLPAPFKPKLYKEKAIVGICLIRLKNIKPKYFPDFLGFSSENGAHRIAVEWQEGNETKEGVYVPRRDTGSKLNAWIGGKLFPGKHYLAKFDVKESNGNYGVAFTSSDDTKIAIQAKETKQIPQTSIFENLANAPSFLNFSNLAMFGIPL